MKNVINWNGDIGIGIIVAGHYSKKALGHYICERFVPKFKRIVH